MHMEKVAHILLSMGATTLLFAAGCQAQDDIVIDDSPGAFDSALPGPQKVGELVEESFRSPAVPAPAAGTEQRVWRQEITYATATYIAPHFSAFDLPEGASLVVKDMNGQRSATYTGQGKDVPGEQGFWGMHMPGDGAVIELYSQVALPAGAVVIDRYARGIQAFNDYMVEQTEKALCGADDSEWAACFQSSEPAVYDKSRAVARLMIGGTSACTGWLVGSEGHLITNEHCIGTASSAANTDYEFMAEGSCNNNCTSWGGCPGIVEASGATFVQSDATLDYTLVLLPNNISSTYGYFQLRQGGGAVGERIYIPQHPQAWGKRIATKDGNNDAVITSLSEAPCSGGKGSDVGYFADTQGGSSGSPVVAYADHAVVALHHCANCPNRGVPVQPIIDDLVAGGNLPADATTGTAPPPPTCEPVGAACTGDSDCCSGRCKGPAGGQVCK